MYTEINRQLEEVQQGIFRLHKIDSMLKSLRGEQLSLENKVSELKEVLDKENQDVKRFEKKSIASIFYSVLGSLDEHVEKEQREALAAKLKYDQAVRDLEDVKHQISKLSSEWMEYSDCENRYDTLYAQKKDMLMKSNTETAQKILDLNRQIDISKNNLREVEEAISAGNRVMDSLRNALNSLDSAESWGTWDLLGGGMISDLAKHSHIDNAKAEAERTQALLRRFKTELADVRIYNNISIETDGFAKFADFFFDGLIADWVMQSKIHNSQESVSQVMSQVQSVLNKLGSLRTQESSNIGSLERKINNLIAEA